MDGQRCRFLRMRPNGHFDPQQAQTQQEEPLEPCMVAAPLFGAKLAVGQPRKMVLVDLAEVVRLGPGRDIGPAAGQRDPLEEPFVDFRPDLLARVFHVLQLAVVAADGDATTLGRVAQGNREDLL